MAGRDGGRGPRSSKGKSGGKSKPKRGGRGATAGAREATVRVRSAKGRKPSSTRWLQRQLNDPYVVAAGRHGYRSRAAWKLVEIDDKFRILKPGAAVLDLGAAPGGWTQVAVERTAGGRRPARVVAVDMQEMDPIADAEVHMLDLDEAEAIDALRALLPDGVDLLFSDMAISATGHRGTDQIRNQRLAELAFATAADMLKPGGAMVLKAFHGGADASLMTELKRAFAEVRSFKPPASRADSAEHYIVARKFRPEGHD